MNFEQELSRSLAESRVADRAATNQKQLESVRAAAVQLQFLDRLEAKFRDVARFLDSHGVHTQPFVEKYLVDKFFDRKKWVEEELGRGWVLAKGWMALATDGQPWWIHEEYNGVIKSAPWGMKAQRRRPRSVSVTGRD